MVNGSFLKVNCSVIFGTTSVNCLYSVTLKATGHLALRMDLLTMHDFVISCVGQLENIGSLSCVGL